MRAVFTWLSPCAGLYSNNALILSITLHIFSFTEISSGLDFRGKRTPLIAWPHWYHVWSPLHIMDTGPTQQTSRWAKLGNWHWDEHPKALLMSLLPSEGEQCLDVGDSLCATLSDWHFDNVHNWQAPSLTTTEILSPGPCQARFGTFGTFVPWQRIGGISASNMGSCVSPSVEHVWVGL
jgi:hypothetical protein